MAESTSQLQAKLKALTHGKVDIMLDANTFKNTTQILREMSGAWEDMTDIERASALELMGGKRQANILASVIKNFDTVEDVIVTSMNSSGSAIAENEKVLDSIQGKINLFTNALQTMWMNLIDSSVVKGVVDTGTVFIKFLDTAYGKIITLIGAFALFEKIKHKKSFADAFKGVTDIIVSITTATKTLTGATLAESMARKLNNEELLQELLTKAGLIGVSGDLTKEQIAKTAATLGESYANGKLTASQYIATASTLGLKEALKALWNVVLANPLLLIAGAIVITAVALDKFTTTAHEAAEAAKEAFNEIKSVVDSTTSTIKELESELETLNNKIEELTGKELSFADNEELKKLKKQREELEYSLKIQEQLLNLQKDAQNKQAIASMRAYTKAASQGAEETQKNAKAWGAFLGATLTGVAAIAAVALTGGAATPAVVAGIAAASAGGGYLGSKQGEVVGSKKAANDGTYDDWYKTYKKAIDTAREDEQKALKEYQKDSSNIEKLDKWKEAQQRTSEIEKEMYNHLSQMQQYMNTLEYGVDEDINAELDTWYNFLDKFSIENKASGAEATALDRIFGENSSEEIQTLKKQILDAVNVGKDFDFTAAINGSQELKDVLDYVGLSAEDVKNYFTQIGEKAKNSSENIVKVSLYSNLLEDAKQYKELLLQTSEIVIDNTSVTEEYKKSLIELVGSETEVNKYFDENNKLIVKNAKGLNNLVKSANKNTVQNTKLAKSQAKLQYYELYKKMKSYINAEGKVIAGKQVEILALYQEMNALEQTISKYSRLETQLLGAANAYEKFEQAQEIDSETDYMSNAEDMISALGQAFSTGELGTESARAAIEGLVPESVYEDLDTVDQKMEAINKYFKEGKLAQYFSLEFDDDGAIASAEMKLGNLRKFIEDGLAGVEGTKVFEGTDWRHFEFSESFLDGLSEADDKLQYFADSMGVTKEVAFAFVESINDHDIEWLNGDYSSLFDVLTPETLENSIYSTIQSISDLNAQLANGKISSEEYNKAMLDLISQEDVLAERAKTDALAWYEKTEKLDEYKSQIQEYYKQLESGKDAEGNLINAEDVRDRIDTIMGNINTLTKELAELEEPTKVTLQLAYDDIQKDLDNIEKEIGDVIEGTHYQFNVDAAKYEVILDENDPNYQKVSQFVSLLNSQHTINTQMGEETPNVLNTLQSINDTLEKIQKLFETKYNLQVNTDGAVTQTRTFKDLWDGIKDKSVTLWSTVKEKVVQYFSRTPKEGDGEVNGTANVSGSAYASGNWGLPTSEHNSLVGELGPEMVVDPHSGRYYTVGDNGAEMVDLPKGAIIFNHKQTKGLLQNGHITSRGKAYAEGNAHVTIWPNASSKNQWKGTGYSSWDDPTYDLKEALDDAAGSVNDFEETIDWIAMRMEELDEALNLYQTRLENQSTYADKNNIIDQMVKINQAIFSNASAGAKYYADYAERYLVGMNKELADAARNGAISITEFTKTQDEATVKAIQNYRDYAGKAASLQEQAEATIASIRDLEIEKIDNIQSYGSAKTSIEDLQTEKLQNIIDYYETKGEIPSSAYYGVNGGNAANSTGMFENSYKKIDYWTPLLADMQTKFNEAVQKGQIEVGSIEWYEQLEKLYQVQAEIDAATIEIEEFQNAINDIYWENFDELINRLDYVQNETQNLIDLMDKDDMIVEPEKRKYENGTVEFWTEDDVKWTDEGIASLGLYAQQMEIAEYKSKQYAEAIDDLTSDYEKGLYSENEYLEKLNELKDGQYDSIQAYYDAQDAIKDLNETRIESIKEGIEKEIEAYEELIEKKKEELSTEKDLYDFQRSTMEQQKSIADIQRKLAALSNDNSASAIAKRKKLEAELAEAKQELDDTYYDRSIEQRQNALDKELEDFNKEKDKEIEKWDEYLTQIEQVVTDSLNIVQANAEQIGTTLTDKANEYNLTVSDAILSPWADGALAVSDYQTTFDTAMSSTTDQLDVLKNKWQEVIDKMAEAAKQDIIAKNQENANYAAARKSQEPTESSNTTTTQGSSSNSSNTSSTTGSETYTVKSGDTLSAIAKAKLGSASKWRDIYNLNKDIIKNPDRIYPGQKLKLPKYGKGTTGVKNGQWSIIDELGLEEIVMHAGPNGKLQYLTKGSAVIPGDISENLMALGQLDPSEVLKRSTPKIGASSSVVNNNMEINMTISEVVHIDKATTESIPDITKAVEKQLNSYMNNLNNAIKAKVR